MAAEEAKAKFEKEKETVLKSLPDNVKDMFGIMGFCKVDDEDDDEENNEGANGNSSDNKLAEGENYVPCLVVSPYNVPPRPVRDIYWWDFYSNRKRKKELNELEYLVYHYGNEDPTDCYSFIPQDEFIAYESGLQSGYDKLPAFIQRKVDAGKELTEEEEQRVRGLKEMQEDAQKPAEERKRGNWQFKERHEQMAEPAKKKQRKK